MNLQLKHIKTVDLSQPEEFERLKQLIVNPESEVSQLYLGLDKKLKKFLESAVETDYFRNIVEANPLQEHYGVDGESLIIKGIPFQYFVQKNGIPPKPREYGGPGKFEKFPERILSLIAPSIPHIYRVDSLEIDPTVGSIYMGDKVVDDYEVLNDKWVMHTHGVRKNDRWVPEENSDKYEIGELVSAAENKFNLKIGALLVCQLFEDCKENDPDKIDVKLKDDVYHVRGSKGRVFTEFSESESKVLLS